MPSSAPLPSPSARTLAAPVEVSGVGLFTGQAVRVTLRPGEPGRGIVFRRPDLPGAQGSLPIAAVPDNIQPEARRTVLSLGPHGPSVQTVEHLLSAVRGLGLSDLEVEVRGPELPIGDGSAALWVEAMHGVGFNSGGGAAASPVVVRQPIRLGADGATVEALPLNPDELAAASAGRGPVAIYAYHLDFANYPIAALAPVACRRVPSQDAAAEFPLNATPGSVTAYAEGVAPARTFSLVEEAEAARRAGLFGHVSPRDLLVIGDQGPIDNVYRFPDEPARHKLLDLIGDLALCGRPIVGRIVARRSGHALNQALARALAELP